MLVKSVFKKLTTYTIFRFLLYILTVIVLPIDFLISFLLLFLIGVILEVQSSYVESVIRLKGFLAMWKHCVQYELKKWQKY